MSQTQRPPEDSRQEPSVEKAEAPKQAYHPPELRELGNLAELTGTTGEGSVSDSGPPYNST